MPASPELVERSGDLKSALVGFSQARRFARHFDKALVTYLPASAMTDDVELANATDRFLFQYRLPDGRTVVEVFVEEHLDLTDEERALLLGWRDAIEGVFQVDGRDGNALVVTNLVDELTYRVHSNMGPAALQKMKKGSFLATRLVPIEDEWLLSGISNIYPAAYRREIYRAAAETALQYPALVFRNPEKVAQGWEMQREERRIFMEFFDSDLVVLAGSELGERLRAYMHFRMHDVYDEDGKSAADRSRETYGDEGDELDFKLTPDLTESETVGVIYDEIDGMMFFRDFGLLEGAFADPDAATERRHQDIILEYLEDPDTSPLALRRLAERYPEQASRIFARLLDRPDFSWDRDGEALLRQYKAPYFDRIPLPRVSPLSSTLARAQFARTGSDVATQKRRRSHQSPSGPKRRSKRRARR